MEEPINNPNGEKTDPQQTDFESLDDAKAWEEYLMWEAYVKWCRDKENGPHE